MLAVAILAVLLYARAFNFGFFNDDPTGHFAWMESRTFLDFFNSSAELRMMPKIGPRADIDLFFASDLCLAFFAGLLCDSIPALRPGRALRVPIVAIALGSAAVGFARLAHHGISF